MINSLNDVLREKDKEIDELRKMLNLQRGKKKPPKDFLIENKL